MTWRKLLRENGAQFLQWLRHKDIVRRSTDDLGTILADVLAERISTVETARRIWEAVPAVLGKCNDPSTYSLPFAAEAYAWLHLLSRYVRTWNTLVELVRAHCLPLGRQGVRVLDVGTGPGPTILAVAAFYRCLSQFSDEQNVDALRQDTFITSVERSTEASLLLHCLAELVSQSYPIVARFHDFETLSLSELRESIRGDLLSKTVFDEELGHHDHIYMPWEANDAAQSAHRYRLIVFSNFLTTKDIVVSFRDVMATMFQDSRAGGTILVIGGKGGSYPQIYSDVKEIARDTGLEVALPPTDVSDRGTEDIIFKHGKAFYQRLQALCPFEDASISDLNKEFQGSTPKFLRSSAICFRKAGTNG